MVVMSEHMKRYEVTATVCFAVDAGTPNFDWELAPKVDDAGFGESVVWSNVLHSSWEESLTPAFTLPKYVPKRWRAALQEARFGEKFLERHGSIVATAKSGQWGITDASVLLFAPGNPPKSPVGYKPPDITPSLSKSFKREEREFSLFHTRPTVDAPTVEFAYYCEGVAVSVPYYRLITKLFPMCSWMVAGPKDPVLVTRRGKTVAIVMPLANPKDYCVPSYGDGE